ncbi:MAG: hypothetical protein ACI8Y7_000717 [Candidatus Woesearchaeota archaeon]|jgi:hypothetical protein
MFKRTLTAILLTAVLSLSAQEIPKSQSPIIFPKPVIVYRYMSSQVTPEQNFKQKNIDLNLTSKGVPVVRISASSYVDGKLANGTKISFSDQRLNVMFSIKTLKSQTQSLQLFTLNTNKPTKLTIFDRYTKPTKNVYANQGEIIITSGVSTMPLFIFQEGATFTRRFGVLYNTNSLGDQFVITPIFFDSMIGEYEKRNEGVHGKSDTNVFYKFIPDGVKTNWWPVRGVLETPRENRHTPPTRIQRYKPIRGTLISIK